MTSKKIDFLKRTFISITLVIILGILPKKLCLQPSQAHSLANRENNKTSLVYSQVKPDKLIKQGKKYYQDRDYTEAIKVWQHARNIYQSQQDKLNQATVWNYLCLAYTKLGQLPAAEKAIASSLKLLDSLKVKNLSVLAQTFNTQGSLQLAQGDNTQQAILTWQEATKIYQQAGDEIGEIGSLINQAQGMQELGLYIKAEKTLTQVKDILDKQKDDELKISGLRKLGNIQRLLGKLTESERILQESLALARSLQSDTQISASLLNLGNTAIAKGEYEKAKNYYQQVVNLSPSTVTQLKARLNQLRVFIDTQEYTKAVKLSRELKPQLDELPINRNNIND